MKGQTTVKQLISVRKPCFAVGMLFALLYAASMIVVMSGSRKVVVRFLNSILHGNYATTIMQWEMPW
jgi:hypothetical protein